MGTKEFFAKGWPTRLGFYLGKYLPPYFGLKLVGVAARTLATWKPDFYWTTRENQRHVQPADISERALHEKVYRVFFYAARNYYELFHNVGRKHPDITNLRPPVYLTPETEQHLKTALDSGRGVFIHGCHMANFDLAGVVFAHYLPVPLHVLGLANPPSGFELFNRLRKRTGAIVDPISPESLRHAIQRLRDGGVVLTGVDRPTGEGDEAVTFFGKTAYLPTGYIRIPLRTDSLIMTLATFFEDGVYWIHTTPPRELIHTGDRRQDIEVNLRSVLDDVEAFIHRRPEQWMMFLPVWRTDQRV